MIYVGHETKKKKFTGHSRVDSANVCEEGYFSKFDCEFRSFDHLVFENLGALGRVIECIDIEITEVDDRAVGSLVVNERSGAVGKDIIEEIILDVFAPERF